MKHIMAKHMKDAHGTAAVSARVSVCDSRAEHTAGRVRQNEHRSPNEKADLHTCSKHGKARLTLGASYFAPQTVTTPNGSHGSRVLGNESPHQSPGTLSTAPLLHHLPPPCGVTPGQILNPPLGRLTQRTACVMQRRAFPV